jgi:hypothetical protein
VGELTSLTVDVTSALAFGHDLNTLERRDSDLQNHIQRVCEMISRRLTFLAFGGGPASARGATSRSLSQRRRWR